MAERAKPKRATAKDGEAPKGKKAKRGDNSGDKTVPDEVIVRHWKATDLTEKAMEEAKKVYDQKKGEHRAAYKLAKDDGVDIKAMQEAKVLDKSDHGVTVSHYSRIARILTAVESPLVTQLDLFAGMEESVKKVEAEKLDEALAGAHAFSNEEPIENNPHIPGTMAFGQWEAGYLRAQNSANGGQSH